MYLGSVLTREISPKPAKTKRAMVMSFYWFGKKGSRRHEVIISETPNPIGLWKVTIATEGVNPGRYQMSDVRYPTSDIHAHL